MKLPAFRDVFGKNQENVDATLLPIVEEKLKAQADVEKANIKADIHAKQIKVTEMLRNKDLNFKGLMDELDSIALLERRLAQYDNVVASLFPAMTTARTVAKGKKK